MIYIIDCGGSKRKLENLMSVAWKGHILIWPKNGQHVYHLVLLAIIAWSTSHIIMV